MAKQLVKRRPKRRVSAYVDQEITGQIKRANARVRSLTAKRGGNTAPLMPLIDTKKLALVTDPFDMEYTNDQGDFSIMEPEIPYGLLAQAGKGNSALNQCVDAYVVNIESYGYQLEYIGPPGAEDKPRYQAEKRRALAFLDNPNGDRTLRHIREERRRDIEYLGTGYFEIGRDRGGRPTFIEHVPTVTMRKTKKDKKATNWSLPVRLPDGTIEQRECPPKHFRRFVQMKGGRARTYFKEYGDPRSIDPKTGKVNPNLSPEEQATEIYCEELYSIGTVYGQPRWLGALPDMLGLRESEVVNLNFFRENAIPAMAILISGGALTEESFEKVQSIITAAKGKDAMNRILILEAAADDSVAAIDQAPAAPKIEIKPMTSERQTDALFKEYQLGAKRKIRSTMRLPAIFTGDSEEYTKATAQSGMRIAEGQVFTPERSKFDDFINHKVLPALGIANWIFRSLGPPVYDPETLSTMVDRFGRHGAMTPNILIKIANQVLDVQIPPVKDKWGDIPFTYTMGMVNAGQPLKEMEELFAEINDAANSAIDPAESGNVPANDNVAARARRIKLRHFASNDMDSGYGAGNRRAAAKFVAQIRQELTDITDELIDRIQDAAAAAV